MDVLINRLSPPATRALRTLMPLAVVAVALSGVAASLWWLVYEPAQERLRIAESVYEAVRQAQADTLMAKRMEEALMPTWEVLTPRKEFPSLILAVSDLAQREGVAIPGMSYGLHNVENGLATKASMSFQVVGDYAAIRRFIHRLETDRRYLAVESLDASRSQKRSSFGLGKESVVEHVRFNVRVMTFLKPDAPRAAGTT